MPRKCPHKQEAIKRGRSKYNTGKLCSQGHESPRWVRGGMCVECMRIRSLALRMKNPNWKPRPIRDEMRANKLRNRAIASGDKTYFTGQPCPHGHICPRRVDSRICCQCQRERSQLYAIAHKRENAERTRAWNQAHPKYWEDKK